MKRFSDFGIDLPPTARGIHRTTCPDCGPTRSTEAHRRSRCLTVWIDTGTWSCNHCGWGKGLSLREASDASQRHRWQPVEAKQSSPPRPAMYDWFAKERHIPRDVVDRNRITQIEGAVAFNYYADDVLVNVKYRTRDKKMWQTSEGTQTPYKHDDLVLATSCIITEGEIDALSFEVAGYPNAVSVPLGAIGENDRNVAGKLRFLELCAETFDRMETVYLATDTDAAGIRTRDELARRIGKKRCMMVRYPEPCKDANDVLVKFGRDALARCIREAEPYPVDGIITPRMLESEYFALAEPGAMTPGRNCHVGDLGALWKIAPSQITLVTGVPNHGKTPLTNQVTAHLSLFYGQRTAYFTPEHKLAKHMARLAQQIIGKPFSPAFNGVMSNEDRRAAFEFICRHFVYIHPGAQFLTLDELFMHAEYLVKRFGINVIVIDPWGYIETMRRSGQSEHEYIGIALRRFRTFADAYGLHWVIIAHPTKLQRDKKTQEILVPTAYDISGSSHWFNYADNILSVYRRRDSAGRDSHTEVHVLKIRDSPELGAPGVCELNYDVSCQRFRRKATDHDKTNLLAALVSGDRDELDSFQSSSMELAAVGHHDDEEPF